MHLVDVLMAGSVFAIASGGSMQICSATALQAQQLNSRQGLEQRIEQDRLQLQTHWRSSGAPDCSAAASQRPLLAAAVPVPTGLTREVLLSPDGQSVQLRWTATADPVLQRQRLVSPAGMGVCGLAPASNAIEGLQP
jgi:hypothetical protein